MISPIRASEIKISKENQTSGILRLLSQTAVTKSLWRYQMRTLLN